MNTCTSTRQDVIRRARGHLLVGILLAVCATGAAPPNRVDDDLDDASAAHAHHVHVHDPEAASAEPPDGTMATAKSALEVAFGYGRRIAGKLSTWYFRTPPADRVTWGAMAACAGLGIGVLLERSVRLRRRKIVPPEFTARFLDQLHEGKLDCGKALDHCERNPSPAARIALAAVRRWDRPASDQERAVAMAHRLESERLRRNVGTLRRIAVLSPLLGLLGSLFALGRALEGPPVTALSTTVVVTTAAPASGLSGPHIAAGLTPLSAGIIIATLALVAYDGLLTRIEKLAGALDRLGAETIDAIAMTAPISTPALSLTAGLARARTPHQDR